jgi:hypothetical protein
MTRPRECCLRGNADGLGGPCGGETPCDKHDVYIAMGRFRGVVFFENGKRPSEASVIDATSFLHMLRAALETEETRESKWAKIAKWHSRKKR